MVMIFHCGNVLRPVVMSPRDGSRGAPRAGDSKHRALRQRSRYNDCVAPADEIEQGLATGSDVRPFYECEVSGDNDGGAAPRCPPRVHVVTLAQLHHAMGHNLKSRFRT